MDASKIARAAVCAYRNFLADKPELKSAGRIWLISERGYDAQDNGAAFFAWLCAQHPEIHAVYVISPNDHDYAKMHALGDTVTLGSQRHYELMYQAEALISTHAFGYTPDMVIYDHLARAGMFNPDGVSVFLQHGVLDKETDWLSRKHFKPDLFEVSTEMEADLIRAYNHQPDSAIMRSGQCRYDALYHSKPKKQILIFPTWRQWLSGASPLEFSASEYHAMWERLIQSSAWDALPSDWSAVFCLHPEAQRYSTCFESECVKVERSSDIGALIRDSSAVITDYSSVYFDFFYRNLPIVFFQFDEARFASEHYAGLSVAHSDFGAVEHDPDQAVTTAISAVTGGAESRMARKDPAKFFLYRDDHNCERTYSAICAKIAQH